MKYRVVGQNRDTAARMVLEFEASSKADAERKAAQSGMTVTRVEDITDGTARRAIDVPEPRRNRRGRGEISRAVAILLLLALVLYLLWPRIQPLLRH